MTLEERMSRVDARFDALERRFAALEELVSRLLSLVVRIAERQGVHTYDASLFTIMAGLDPAIHEQPNGA